MVANETSSSNRICYTGLGATTCCVVIPGLCLFTSNLSRTQSTFTYYDKASLLAFFITWNILTAHCLEARAPHQPLLETCLRLARYQAIKQVKYSSRAVQAQGRFVSKDCHHWKVEWLVILDSLSNECLPDRCICINCCILNCPFFPGSSVHPAIQEIDNFIWVEQYSKLSSAIPESKFTKNWS